MLADEDSPDTQTCEVQCNGIRLSSEDVRQTHDLPKGPKQAIKLLFQAAALRVLFCARGLDFLPRVSPIHYLFSLNNPPLTEKTWCHDDRLSVL